MKKEKNVLMMIGDVHRIFHNKLRNLAEENGLVSSYRPIIFHLSHNDGLSQLDLVKRTRFKAPTISLTLQKMEQEGYVIRKPSLTDARVIQVFLTEKGKEYEKKMMELVEKLEQKILPKLDAKETEKLEIILNKLINIMCTEFGEYNHENF